jgi:hypothetical protein
MDVFRKIARGDIFYYELVVPEGQNMFEIGAAAEQLGVFKAVDFVKAAEDPALIGDLDPQAPTLEGYLFPSTYRLGHSTTPQQLCRMMTARFRTAWRSLDTNAGVHETVTLASLVEKEDKLEEERPLIAAVFTNRLRLGMKLECDPTTIYAALLLGVYRGTIYRSDLDRSHPYNTSISCAAPTVPARTSFPRTWRRMPPPPRNIAVASASSVKQRLREYLAASGPPAITEAVWFDLLRKLAPVSESYLRELLRQTALPFEQPYAGVRQHTFAELEESLGEMLAVYRDATAAGNRQRARYCRRQVIGAKDRARHLARDSRTTPEKKAQKEEMAAWMLVWLETPEVFPAWVAARKRVATG